MEAKARAKLLTVDPTTGVSIYHHLVDTVASLIATTGADDLPAFEHVSKLVKQTHAKRNPLNASPPSPPNEHAPPAVADDARITQLKKIEQLLTPADDADASLTPPETLDELATLELAGVGLPRAEGFRLHASLTKLQQASRLSSVRFFGKVFGTAADYYVAEGTYVDEPEAAADDAAESAVPVEPRGEGCNALTYFVTTNLAEPWDELPQVTPAQIVASRSVRKFLTGNLDAPIRAHPTFPGKEASYLRAQIARIAHETTLCPAGKFHFAEDDEGPAKAPVPIDDEDHTPPPSTALAEHSGWCRYAMGILAIGRTTNPPEEEEEVDEGAETKPDAREPEIQALAPISPESHSVLPLRQLGAGSCLAVARSLRWPGAYSVATPTEDILVNVYLGFAQETLDAPYVPPPPAPLQLDEVMPAEQADPPLEEENAPILAEAEAEIAADGVPAE